MGFIRGILKGSEVAILEANGQHELSGSSICAVVGVSQQRAGETWKTLFDEAPEKYSVDGAG